MNKYIVALLLGVYPVLCLIGCDAQKQKRAVSTGSLPEDEAFVYLDENQEVYTTNDLAEIPVPYRAVVAILPKNEVHSLKHDSRVATASVFEAKNREKTVFHYTTWGEFRVRAEMTHRAAWTARKVDFRARQLTGLKPDSNRQQQLQDVSKKMREMFHVKQKEDEGAN